VYVFCGRDLLLARLRRANIDASAGAVEATARIGELAGELMLGLISELPSDQFACTVAHPVGDGVAGDVENLAIVGDAPHDDVRMGWPVLW